MGWLQFVASLADSLAWPLSVVALAVVFRPMISQLDLTGVRRWKAGPAGIEIENWDREASETKASLARQKPRAEKSTPAEIGLSKQLEIESQENPSVAVLEAFSQVEAELRKIITDAEITDERDPERMSARQLSLLALENDLITSESASAVEGLSILRNLAAHGQAKTQLDPTRAVEYLHLSEGLLYALRTKP